MDPDSAKMTGFWWGNRCFYYKRVPFGLKNVLAHFQRVMDHELARMHHHAASHTHHKSDFCVAYMDDLLIYSKTPGDHIDHVQLVLEHRASKHTLTRQCSLPRLWSTWVITSASMGSPLMRPRWQLYGPYPAPQSYPSYVLSWGL